MTEATQEQEAPISLHLPTQEAKRTETPAFHGSGLSLPMVYRLFLTVRTKEKKKGQKLHTPICFFFSFRFRAIRTDWEIVQDHPSYL